MKTISKFFIENSKLTVVLSIGLIIFGIMGTLKMNSQSFPTVNFAQAIVTTRYDGASASDIETKITKPLEDEIRTVSGIKDVRSVSQAGLSTIFIRGDIDNIDPKIVMGDLQKAVDRVTNLPRDLNDAPAFLEIKSEEFPVIQIALTGENTNRERDQIADALKEEIEDDKRVKRVSLSGFTKRRFQIALDREKLDRNYIGINEVLSKVQSRNQNIPGGSLKGVDQQKLLRIEGKIENSEELENILIRSNLSGSKILLKDVATVTDSKNELKLLTRYNGKEATLLTVSKKANADTIALVKVVQQKIERFNKLYKDQVKLNVFYNESIKVEKKLDVLKSNAVTGLILVVVFLFIFLPGRVGVLASLSLPLAILGTLGLMPSFGMNLDAITILALVIALGMLVDNSVVISENYTRLRGEGQDNKEAALNSVQQLWLPITATAFTTIAAFIPMLVTKGIMGQFIKWIPIVVTISLILSLAESFIFLPMRLAIFGGKGRIDKEGKSSSKDWFSKFESFFERVMDTFIKRRYLMALAFIGIIFTSFFMMGKANKFNLFPPEQTEIYLSRYSLKKGSPIEKTHIAGEKISKEILSKLGDKISHIISRAGESKVQLSDPKAVDGSNVGIVFIYVNEDTKNNISHTNFLKELRKIKPDYVSGISFEAQINGPPVGEAVEGTFRSNNMDSLNLLLTKLTTELKQIPGMLNVSVNDVVEDEEVYVNIDYNKVDNLGLNVNTIGNTVRTAVSGKNISTVTLNNKDIDLRLRLKAKMRENISDLEKIKVMDNKGNLVPLGSFATFKTQEGTPQIKRFDFKRSKTLTASIDDKIITSLKANKIVENLYNKISKEVTGVSLIFGGAAESTKESMQSLAQAGVLALIGIFAILVFLFKSYLRPIIVMFTIPLGLLGLSLAFYTPIISGFPDRSREISFMALIGIIGLAGIIVNSGIVLISFIDQMRAEGKLPLHDILVKASGMRLRAVLVTSLTTISGLIPTAYGIGGSDSMLVPMTMAMAWGLTSGTILTLVFIPCAYAILEDFNSLMGKVMARLNIGTSQTIINSEKKVEA